MLKTEKSNLQTLSSEQKAKLTRQEAQLQEKINLLTKLRNDMTIAEAKITDFKSQVASLIAKRLELNENLKLEMEKTSKRDFKQGSCRVGLSCCERYH